jgi:hypothetical protein
LRRALHGTTYVIDYILAVANVAFSEKCDKISYEDIHKIIKDVAIKAQIAQEIDAGKRYHDYRKKSQEDENFMREAADKTVSAMITWGLMERIPSEAKETKKARRYHVKQTLHAIGQETNRSQTDAARLILFDRMLRSEKETAFNIDFFLKIRDSHSSSNVSVEFKLPDEGVILWSAANLRNNFEISQPDFNILTVWCKQLGLLNIFDPKALEITGPKEVYLSVWIASVSELAAYCEKGTPASRTDVSSVDKNCDKILKKIGATYDNQNNIVTLCGFPLDISNNEFVLRNLNTSLSSDLLVVGERKKTQQLIFNKKMANFEKVYLILRKQPSLDEFTKTLIQNYNQLKITLKTPYVWISALRSLCARSLQITDKQFDDFLVQYYRLKPEAMEFSKAATGYFRRRVRIFEKPFKLYEQTFRMIRLVDST